jgi:hypothetical protein
MQATFLCDLSQGPLFILAVRGPIPTDFTMKSQCKSDLCTPTDITGPCHRLGPYPATAVATLADLGLSDQEIAGYFRIPPERVTRLRLGIAPELRLVSSRDDATTVTSDR